jgi:hypothetical protein
MRRLKLPADEADLSAQKAGKWRHPFMRAKSLGGIADRTCKRILLMCNIGVRGINNWPILAAVDCTEKPTIVELIQFDVGRPIRLTERFAHFLADKDLREFVTLRIYIPAVANADAKEKRFAAARSFILNMQDQIAGRGFQTWADIVAGHSIDDMPTPDNSISAQPFTAQDRFGIINGMGEALALGADLHDETEIARIVGSLRPEATGARREQAQKYACRLRDVRVFRDDELLAVGIEREAAANPESVLTQLKPQDAYPTEMLLRFVKTDGRFASDRQIYLDALDRGDTIASKSVALILHDVQRAYYREPPRTWRLQGDGGVLRTIAGELSYQLIASGSLPPQERGEVNKAVNIVTSRFFGVADAKEGGPMDYPPYHVAILGRCKRRLLALAHAHLTRNGKLPFHARVAAMP